jgi:NADH-quinone oxidoreductase subunit A
VCFFLINLLLFISWNFRVEEVIDLNQEKITAYECGFDPFCESHLVFDVKYYLVAILFILFDLEIIYLLPWMICINTLTIFHFIGLLLFLFILTFGFIYEWLKGALEWN